MDATLVLSGLPTDCLTAVLKWLPFRDQFSAARAFRRMREALLSLPILGLPALEVESVQTLRTRAGGREYLIRYAGSDETDVLNPARPEAATRLIGRFQTHFIVLFTLDSRFLATWTAIHGAARIAARKEAKAKKAKAKEAKAEEAKAEEAKAEEAKAEEAKAEEAKAEEAKAEEAKAEEAKAEEAKAEKEKPTEDSGS